MQPKRYLPSRFNVAFSSVWAYSLEANIFLKSSTVMSLPSRTPDILYIEVTNCSSCLASREESDNSNNDLENKTNYYNQICFMGCIGLFMVFNTTFNNVSIISWQSVLLVEETGVHGENHWSVTSNWPNFIT